MAFCGQWKFGSIENWRSELSQYVASPQQISPQAVIFHAAFFVLEIPLDRKQCWVCSRIELFTFFCVGTLSVLFSATRRIPRNQLTSWTVPMNFVCSIRDLIWSFYDLLLHPRSPVSLYPCTLRPLQPWTSLPLYRCATCNSYIPLYPVDLQLCIPAAMHLSIHEFLCPCTHLSRYPLCPCAPMVCIFLSLYLFYSWTPVPF